MIFPYDSEGAFSDPKAASPTQRPASNSEGRKRAHPSEIRPKGGLSDGCDPHLDNGFAEVIRKAKAEAWNEGFTAGYNEGWDDGWGDAS